MPAMNENLLSDTVQAYLRSHLDSSPSELALKKSPFATVSSSELAEQLDGMQRSKSKLPLWHQKSGIYYPRQVSMEQTSSERTAQYKKTLVKSGDRIVDITGGFGVDAFYLAQTARHVTYIEQSTELVTIVNHNMRVLGAQNTHCLAGDGISHVLQCDEDTYDTVYTDPSRRVQGQKVVNLRDYEPDIVAFHTILLGKAKTLIIKAAPMLDIKSALSQLANVAEIHVLSVENECKELLFVLKRDYIDEPRIIANLLSPMGRLNVFSFFLTEEEDAKPSFSLPKQYLYEPDAAIMKSGPYKLLSTHFGLDKIHANTHLYTSEKHIPQFPGRSLRIIKSIPYGQFKKEKVGHAGNVTVRNFPLKPDELRRKHRIAENKDQYLFFCTNIDNQLIVIFASK